MFPMRVTNEHMPRLGSVGRLEGGIRWQHPHNQPRVPLFLQDEGKPIRRVFEE